MSYCSPGALSSTGPTKGLCMADPPMADHQTEPRLTIDLPVRVWGMNAEGRAFSQHARALNVSSEGALISGLESELKVGDVIGVQCEEKKARCSVIWAMNTGFISKNQVGA